jgi:8-oxo-dGTP diphosphatase
MSAGTAGSGGHKRPTTPLLTVDVIIEVEGGIVLIERKNPPPGWALPGGFVDVGEGVAAAAVREAKEETSLDVTLSEQFFTYSDPSRDARGHTASVVFLGRASGEPCAADDARAVKIYALDELPPLAFDHGQILDDYRRYKQTGVRPPVTR